MDTTQIRSIVGLCGGGLVRCRARVPFPDAPDWEVDLTALCLGEVHHTFGPSVMTSFTVVDLIRLAALRAEALDRRLDVYVEATADRAVWAGPDDHHADDWLVRAQGDVWGSRAAGQSLREVQTVLTACIPPPHEAQVRGWPDAILNPAHARVHAFDTRPESSRGAPTDDMTDRVDRAYFERVVARPRVELDDWAWYLMGFDADRRLEPASPPPGLIEEAAGHFGDETPRWLRLRERAGARIRRRAGRLPLPYCRRLAELVLATVSRRQSTHPTLGMMVMMTSDFYALVRMLAPYGGGDWTPRICILYAGDAHRRHVQAVLSALTGAVQPIEFTYPPNELRVADIEVPGPPIDTVDDLLTLLGLPGDPVLPRALTVYHPLRRARPRSLQRAKRAREQPPTPPTPTPPTPMDRAAAVLACLEGWWTFSAMYRVRAELAAGAMTSIHPPAPEEDDDDDDFGDDDFGDDDDGVSDDQVAVTLAVRNRRIEVLPDIVAVDRSTGWSAAHYNRALSIAVDTSQPEAVAILVDSGLCRPPVTISDAYIDDLCGARLDLPVIVVAAFREENGIVDSLRAVSDESEVDVAAFITEYQQGLYEWDAVRGVLVGAYGLDDFAGAGPEADQ
jgi:hypothetical protein